MATHTHTHTHTQVSSLGVSSALPLFWERGGVSETVTLRFVGGYLTSVRVPTQNGAEFKTLQAPSSTISRVTVRRWRWLWLCRFFLTDPRAQAATLSKETLQEIVRRAPWLRIVLSENHPQQKCAEALIFPLHNPENVVPATCVNGLVLAAGCAHLAVF